MKQPRVVIAGDTGLLDRVVARLRDPNADGEELTFAFAHVRVVGGETVFECFSDRPIAPSEFVYRDWGHIEMRDDARADVMTSASRLGASLVEFHSHPYPYPACFSPSDKMGFREFVPYAWWRLGNRPYAAVVVAPDSLDAIAWLTASGEPVPVAAVQSVAGPVTCTGLFVADGEGV